jgi:hypothetical protein
MINVDERKSEYLGNNPTFGKIKEMLTIIDITKDYIPPEIDVIAIQDGVRLENKLSDFRPSDIVGKAHKLEYIDNLLYTIELNPAEVIIKTPDGLEYKI